MLDIKTLRSALEQLEEERKIPKVNLKITELSEQLTSLKPQDLQYQTILQNLKDVKIASKVTGLL